MRAERESDYQWPPITAATLLAQLEATRKADQETRDRLAYRSSK